jgi:hypothetical protein
LSSSRQGRHNFLFSQLFLLLFQSYFLPCISNSNQSLGVWIERQWCILMLFGVY